MPIKYKLIIRFLLMSTNYYVLLNFKISAKLLLEPLAKTEDVVLHMKAHIQMMTFAPTTRAVQCSMRDLSSGLVAKKKQQILTPSLTNLVVQLAPINGLKR